MDLYQTCNPSFSEYLRCFNSHSVFHKAAECKGSKKKQHNAAKTKIQLDVQGSQKGKDPVLCTFSVFFFFLPCKMFLGHTFGQVLIYYRLLVIFPVLTRTDIIEIINNVHSLSASAVKTLHG